MLEIAQRLVAQGEDVALAAIFDSSGPGMTLDGSDPGRASYDLSLPGKVFFHLRSGQFPAVLFNYIKYKIIRNHLRKILWRGAPFGWVYEQLHGAQSYRNRRAATLQNIVYSDHEVRPYPGTITLFRSEAFTRRRSKDKHIDSWSKIALGGVDVFVVDGDHRSMFKPPHVMELAAKLQSRIDGFEASGNEAANKTAPMLKGEAKS